MVKSSSLRLKISIQAVLDRQRPDIMEGLGPKVAGMHLALRPSEMASSKVTQRRPTQDVQVVEPSKTRSE